MSQQQAHFQPPPPIRTSTADSKASQSSGAMSPGSDMASPTSPSGRGQAASPTEESFFGAIVGRVQRARSRSRSRSNGNGGSGRTRSKSPMLPPEQLPPPSNVDPTSPTYSSHRPKQSRHVSTNSQSSTTTKASRPSLQGPSRRSTSGSDPWVGRHSNEWLFGGFSVRETAKDLLRKP